MEESLKNNKKQSRDTNSRDVKLNRLAEELEKYKNLYQESRTHVSELQQAHAAEIQALSLDMKRVDRQRQDLAQAFKKQSQLVTVLRKQKIHLEASAWLKLTEREFLRTLDWDKQ